MGGNESPTLLSCLYGIWIFISTFLSKIPRNFNFYILIFFLFHILECMELLLHIVHFLKIGFCHHHVIF